MDQANANFSFGLCGRMPLGNELRRRDDPVHLGQILKTMTTPSRRLIAATLLCTTFSLPAAILRAADAAEAHDHMAAGHDHDEDTPLHHNMEDMGRAMRTLNKGLNSADPSAAKTDLLAAIQKMETLAVEGKTLTPASIAKMPEAEQPAKLAAFRADLAGTIQTMLEIERAMLADDWAKARDEFKHMRDQRKDGHEKYNPDQDKP